MSQKSDPGGFLRRARQAVSDYGLTALAMKEVATSVGTLLRAYEGWSLMRAALYRRAGKRYEEARPVCQAVRLAEDRRAPEALRRAHARVLEAAGTGPPGGRALDDNMLVRSFLASGRARDCAARYAQYGEEYVCYMKYPTQGDTPARVGLLVPLKQYDEATGEKGVLYLQYTESIESFVALFNMPRIAKRYALVVEPSWWGYQEAPFLLLVGKELHAVVLAQDEPDFHYISGLDSNLHPIRLGAGDWVDPAHFCPRPGETKRFDFVMVANWSRKKRHALFFRSLAAAGLASASVALIGVPWGDRTRADIEGLAARAGLSHVTIFERVHRDVVAEVVRSSRVGVMLTKREGANRGVYEYLFSDVPVVLTASNRGVNKTLINEHTGCLASDEGLPAALARMLEISPRLSPREWMLRHSGCDNAWRALNELLAMNARKMGEPYERPIARIKSAPDIDYKSAEDAASLRAVYDDLRDSLRNAAR